MQKELIDEIKEIVIPDGENVLEVVIGFITKDPMIFIKEIKELLKKPICIQEILFWNNFRNFLLEGNFNYSMIRSLSEKLESEGDSKDSAIKIVESIGKVDEPIKSKYIANLTKSFINGSLDKIKYFRLINVVGRLISADMLYLADNVEYSGIIEDDLHIDEFLSCGLMMTVEGGYAYNEKAYDLVEFGIKHGHSLKRPHDMPKRLVMLEATDEDIDDIISGNYQEE